MWYGDCTINTNLYGFLLNYLCMYIHVHYDDVLGWLYWRGSQWKFVEFPMIESDKNFIYFFIVKVCIVWHYCGVHELYVVYLRCILYDLNICNMIVEPFRLNVVIHFWLCSICYGSLRFSNYQHIGQIDIR